MRSSLAYALISVAAIAGCGGGGLGTNPDQSLPPDMTQAPPDLTVLADMTPPPDVAYNPPLDADGISCGNQTCANGQKCCVVVQGMMPMGTCMDSCGDGQLTVACDGPEDCMGNPCCAKIKGMTVDSVACTAAQTDCPPEVGQANSQTRLCHIDADCTVGAPNTNLNLCCTVMQNHICLNKLFAGGANGTCP